MTRFGDFAPLCTSTPSYPWCNLFYRQLQRTGHAALFTGASNSSRTAGVGINPTCFIAPTFSPASDPPSPHLGNIANIVACALSLALTIGLVWLTQRRKAAVGRIELRALLVLYAISLPLNAISTGAFLAQGSTALVVITAVHAGVVAAIFWALLANALVATQVVEDGTLSSLVPYYIFTVLIFALGTYISLDIALGVTDAIGAPAIPVQSLRNIPLFVVLSIWPLIAVVAYVGIMAHIVLNVLNERRPMLFYALAGMLFLLSQLAWFLLGRVLCTVRVFAKDRRIVPGDRAGDGGGRRVVPRLEEYNGRYASFLVPFHDVLSSSTCSFARSLALLPLFIFPALFTLPRRSSTITPHALVPCPAAAVMLSEPLPRPSSRLRACPSNAVCFSDAEPARRVVCPFGSADG
ncbi:hypothetical protein H0H81_008160 [Sphagnurus paluster]|uniref:Chitin synthase export chaperone n=1 Tax=Sphagnurus paluster TaxID=117069 RepID=A0A9P7GR18_9AGAR|nr:hypothetical protein H0H81_008160 [Sphagnurus paluster]